jgi:asparagine synthase (glutamine-hydrolysing)
MCGVEMHSPYLDSPIIRTCLSLTAALRTGVSDNKPLFRRALAGLVPTSTLDRRTKGDYTADQYVGLRRSAPFLRALFREPIAAELGVLEPRPLLAVLDRGLLGLDLPWPAFTTAVATEIWLRRFHDREIPFAGTVT